MSYSHDKVSVSKMTGPIKTNLFEEVLINLVHPSYRILVKLLTDGKDTRFVFIGFFSILKERYDPA